MSENRKIPPFVWDHRATSHPDCNFNLAIKTTSDNLEKTLSDIIEKNINPVLIDLEEEEHTFDEYTFFKAIYDYESKYNTPCKWVLTDKYYNFLYLKYENILGCLGSDSEEEKFSEILKKLKFDTLLFDGEATSNLILKNNPKIKIVATVSDNLPSKHEVIVPRFVLQEKYYKPLILSRNMANYKINESSEVKRIALKTYANYYAKFFTEYAETIEEESNIDRIIPFSVRPGYDQDSDESDEDSEDEENERVIVDMNDYENSEEEEDSDEE